LRSLGLSTAGNKSPLMDRLQLYYQSPNTSNAKRQELLEAIERIRL
jgi:hypothetical protein